ncbi:MAG: helix-turn-helix domain-containing protein [Bacteroidota bacterium]
MNDIRTNYLFGFLLCTLVFVGKMSAQSTFLLEKVPSNTPDSDSIFLAGSFNNWNPGDPAFLLQKRRDGKLSITLAHVEPPFEYKYTRGNWDKGESDGLGKPVSNRSQKGGVGPLTLSDEVYGWEDLPNIVPIAKIKVVLEEIPENTPLDAALFLTGNFNSWLPGDPQLRFEKNGEDLYQVSVPVYNDTLEFKVCRGNWANVEGRKSGRARFNRRYILNEKKEQEVKIKVESWEDLSGTPINAYTIFWLMAAVQGLLLILVINTLQRPIPRSNQILSLLLLVFSLTLISRVAVYDREIFQWLPRLLLIPDFLYFLYAPLFVTYISRLLRSRDKGFQLRDLLQFIPFFLHLLFYIPFFLMDKGEFINLSVDQRFRPTFERLGGFAFLYNLGYWVYAQRMIRSYEVDSDNQYSSGSNVNFLKTVMWLKAICLVLWAGIYAIGTYGWIQDLDLAFMTDTLTDSLWIGFSLTVFLLGYFALKEPDIFRLPETQVENPLIEAINPPEEDAEKEQEVDTELKMRVGEWMEKERPFLNPKLSLPDLAEQIGTNPHELSRVINQGYGRNFNDFVNSYRVEAFKQTALDPAFQHHTFLAIALHVGFNSKTAFNRSFKKLTGQTPREYFEQGKEDQS